MLYGKGCILENAEDCCNQPLLVMSPSPLLLLLLRPRQLHFPGLAAPLSISVRHRASEEHQFQGQSASGPIKADFRRTKCQQIERKEREERERGREL
jgi:hypothetical protein